ncbi:GNAT family N-acetyltransferase [Nocardioides campestrisoli]|uniref:GNAT family N-acetyltransferase n=1 Tax=Nocardioides campestrisoli TaxID=2736757 RepID=UPI00163D8CFE|nr:GNAT family N-acetyltransferase [Nocardioides campestrisoli]
MRACTSDDAAFLADLYADREVARFIGGDRLTAESAARHAQKFAAVWRSHGYGQSILVDKSSGEQIGRVGLHPWPEWDELELGWVLARRSQGRGLAQEAAQAWLAWASDVHPAPYLTAVIHPDNHASIRLAERLSFTFLRPDVTPWSDAVIYRHDLSARPGAS